MDFSDLYQEYINQTPNDFYHDFTQATFDYVWDDTTQMETVYEENYPFDNTYECYQAHVNSVSEFIVNTTKVSGDYIRIMFQDIDHPYNRRGQKYKITLDGEHENVYLCYDKLNSINNTPDFKCIKCNNVLTFLNNSGQIIKEPCSIGYELSATNNGITKNDTIEQKRLVCLVQINENTKEFIPNDRFLLTKRSGFKITQINDMNKEHTFDEDATMMTMYIEWSAVTSNDNADLLIADYYNYDYVLSINSANLTLINGSSGQLTATVKLNDEIQSNIPLLWSTSDSSVVTIDSQGNYQVIGLDGSTAQITCQIDGNTNVYDIISVNVVASSVDSKEIIINPSDDFVLLLNREIPISYGVYNNDILTSDIVTITPSGATTDAYSLTYDTNIVKVKNLKKSTTKLTLTFSSGVLTDKVINITLGGIM